MGATWRAAPVLGAALPRPPPSWVLSSLAVVCPQSCPFPPTLLQAANCTFTDAPSSFFCVQELCSVNSVIFSPAGFQVFIIFEFHTDRSTGVRGAGQGWEASAAGGWARSGWDGGAARGPLGLSNGLVL